MTLPNNLITERTVLMSCLFQYNALEHVATTLELTDFFDDCHRNIFSVLKDLIGKRVPVSIDSLLTELSIRKNVDAVKLAMGFCDENLDIQFLESKIDDLKSMGLHRAMINKCLSGASQFHAWNGLTLFRIWSMDIRKMILIEQLRIF